MKFFCAARGTYENTHDENGIFWNKGNTPLLSDSTILPISQPIIHGLAPGPDTCGWRFFTAPAARR